MIYASTNWRKRVSIMLSLVLLLSLLAGPGVVAAKPETSPPAQSSGWWAEYFDNTGLQGDPVVSRFEPAIDNDWGSGAPVEGVPANNFSVRWTKAMHFDPATYRFTLTVDDGARLWIDGELLIDGWQASTDPTFTITRTLTAGSHTIQIAYFKETGPGVARFSFEKLDGDFQFFADWKGLYWNNTDLSGDPAWWRSDDKIAFDWGNGSPHAAIRADHFSAQWTRAVSFETGTYRFFAFHDDGARVWVGDRQVINEWHEQLVNTSSGTLALTEGTYFVRVEYFEATGLAQMGFWWEKISDTPPAPATPTPTPKPDGDRTSLVVDNKDKGFIWGGPDHRFKAQGGHGGDFFWTYNTRTQPVNYGKWLPALTAPGQYEVFAFIPATHATSGNVRYRVLHDGQRHDRIVNQARHFNAWVSLGTYSFNAANDGREFVLVYDNTREPGGARMIAFDAVKWVPR